MQGQINLDSPAGQMIRDYAAREDVHTIVEIGTWNGRGSTMCVIEGLKDKTEYSFTTLEADPRMYETALNLKPDFSGVNYVYGTIVKPDEFYTENLQEHEQPWLIDAIAISTSAPLAMHHIPETIDLLVLDGCEFATRAEFLKLKGRTRHIFLDDNSIRKNTLNRKDLLEDNRFETVADHPTDRNGWAMFSLK